MTGTQREVVFSREEGINQKPESNQGDAITWISKRKVPSFPSNQEPEAEMDILSSVSLVGADEIHVEKTGKVEWVDKNGRHKGAKMHVGYNLKREK